MPEFFIPERGEQSLAVQRWVAARVRDFEPDPETAVIAVLKGKSITGAVAYYNYRGGDIEFAGAGSPGWLDRTALRVFFAYPFEQLKVRRLTAVCHRKNKRARSIVQRLGFRFEGVKRRAYPDYGDGIMYGMIGTECRWIK